MKRRRSVHCVVASAYVVGLLLASIPIGSEAWVELTSDGRVEKFASTTFVHFGPQARSSSTPAIYERSGGMQHRPDDALGKVVLLNPLVPGIFPCKPGEMYAAYDKAGALALLVGTDRPLGTHTFWHDGWDKNVYRRRSLTMLEVPLKATERFSESEVTVRTGPPHERSFYDLCHWWVWVVAVRAPVPLLATCAAMVAYGELRRQMILSEGNRRGPRRPDRGFAGRGGPNALPQVSNRCNTRHSAPLKLVCLLETGIMAVVAIEGACGNFGPNVLPSEIVLLLSVSFRGGQLFSTIVLLLLMNEKLSLLENPRNLPAGKTIPAFFLDHKKVLAISFMLTFGMDVSSVLLLGSGVFGLQRIIYPLEQICNINLMIILWFASDGSLDLWRTMHIPGQKNDGDSRGVLNYRNRKRSALTAGDNTSSHYRPRSLLAKLDRGGRVCAACGSVVDRHLDEKCSLRKIQSSLLWGKFFLNLLRCFKTIAQTQAMKPHQPKITPVWTHRTTLTIVWG